MSQYNKPRHRVTIRPRAIEDIQKLATYLEINATAEVVQRFRASIMETVEQIEQMPGAGAPRQVNNLRLSGLRMRSVRGFRDYLIFYITPLGTIEIIRLLHGAQDVGSILENQE